MSFRYFAYCFFSTLCFSFARADDSELAKIDFEGVTVENAAEHLAKVYEERKVLDLLQIRYGVSEIYYGTKRDCIKAVLGADGAGSWIDTQRSPSDSWVQSEFVELFYALMKLDKFNPLEVAEAKAQQKPAFRVHYYAAAVYMIAVVYKFLVRWNQPLEDRSVVHCKSNVDGYDELFLDKGNFEVGTWGRVGHTPTLRKVVVDQRLEKSEDGEWETYPLNNGQSVKLARGWTKEQYYSEPGSEAFAVFFGESSYFAGAVFGGDVVVSYRCEQRKLNSAHMQKFYSLNSSR